MNQVIELRNHLLELRHFHIRLAVAAIFVTLLFLVLFSRFFYLQVLRSDHFTTLAEANRITILPLVPNRGLIYDRHGEILAQNLTTYVLEIVPDKIRDLDLAIDELSKLIEITPVDRRRFEKLRKENTRFKNLPIRTHLSDVEVARLQPIVIDFPVWKLMRAYFVTTLMQN